MDLEESRLKLFKVLRLLRLAKLLRLLKTNQMLQYVEVHYEIDYAYLQLSTYVIMLGGLCHWLACGWYTS